MRSPAPNRGGRRPPATLAGPPYLRPRVPDPHAHVRGVEERALYVVEAVGRADYAASWVAVLFRAVERIRHLSVSYLTVCGEVAFVRAASEARRKRGIRTPRWARPP